MKRLSLYQLIFLKFHEISGCIDVEWEQGKVYEWVTEPKEQLEIWKEERKRLSMFILFSFSKVVLGFKHWVLCSVRQSPMSYIQSSRFTILTADGFGCIYISRHPNILRNKHIHFKHLQFKLSIISQQSL